MSGDLQPAFRALGDATRRDILLMLTTGDMTLADITDRFDITRAAIKKHLTILEEGGLVLSHVQGRTRIHRLNGPAIRPVFDWIAHFDRFWDDRLAALKSTVEKDTP